VLDRRNDGAFLCEYRFDQGLELARGPANKAIVRGTE